MLSTINFKKWIDDNRHLLKPPVGNKLIWEDSEFIAMVVGGPNSRTDYHVDESDEFFYQIEGTMTLKIIENGRPRDLQIAAGEIFMLPSKVPHSPRRPAGTIGLVIERKRRAGELDGFQWYCEKCGTKLFERFVQVSDIGAQLPKIFDEFYSNANHSTCKQCGTRVQRPA